MNLVCSWGGVGTTFFLDYLEQIEHYQVNPSRGYLNPLKHPLHPPALAQRAVFLFGCPYLSLLSLFRRGFDALHYVNINNLFPPSQAFPHGDLWLQSCERFGLKQERPGVWVAADGQYADKCGALDWLKAQKRQREQALSTVELLAAHAYRDLDDFLSKQKDVFRRQEQWNNWKLGANYPVMLVRYESLWKNQEKVLRFLQVPVHEWRRFPAQRERKSSLQGLSAEQTQQLYALYGDLYDEIQSSPDLVEL